MNNFNFIGNLIFIRFPFTGRNHNFIKVNKFFCQWNSKAKMLNGLSVQIKRNKGRVLKVDFFGRPKFCNIDDAQFVGQARICFRIIKHKNIANRFACFLVVNKQRLRLHGNHPSKKDCQYCAEFYQWIK